MIKHHRLVIALLVTLVYISASSAQTNFAILEKNFNVRAQDLFHELNQTKDSLIIRSKERIKYIYSINKNYKREIFTYVGKELYEVSLNKLSIGKHVMVVNYNSKLIVFVIKIFSENPELLLIDDEIALKDP